jgi:hypothetical protein
VGYVPGCEVEIVFNGSGRQQRIDYRGRVTCESLDLAADRAPTECNGVRHGEKAPGESCFESKYTLLEAGTERIPDREVMDAFLVFGDGKNAQEQHVSG